MSYTYDEAFAASKEYFNGNELAAKVFVDKYALRNDKNEILEKTPDDSHKRQASEFARIEKKKFKNPLSEEQIYSYLKNYSKIIPQGSPQYGIGNKYQITSLSNCFVIDSPEDSYGGICKYDEELVQLSKRRGGVGGDVSTIRPKNSPTKNSSRFSTGLIPFMGRWSNSIREVGQDGRRGAKMMTLSVHHPEAVIPWNNEEDGQPYDIEVIDDNRKFTISSKYYNPKKLDFATVKYDKSKVTGANISLRITDEFMNAMVNNEDYEQRWPVDSKNPRISKKINAREAWDKIIYGAWRSAEPGVLFWDTITRESIPDCYSKFGFKTLSTNPCGEIVLSAYDSCRLLVLNLFSYVINPFTKSASFDYKQFYNDSQVAQRLMDDLVDLEEECVVKIIEKIKNDPEKEETKARELNLWSKILEVCRKGRRTGTGITALGDTLAALNISYASEEGRKTTEKIYETLKFGAYKSSIDMAKELGTFPIWNHELEKDNPYLNRIKNSSIALNNPIDKDYIEVINGYDLWSDMKKYGRRNIALLTTAPVGTISILAKLINRYGTSSGIEPEYSWKPYIRRKKINPNDQHSKSDFVDQNGDHFQEFKVYPQAIQEYIDITGDSNIEKSIWAGNSAEEIDWTLRVKLQATAQSHIDHSISSTVNLPENVSVEEVKKIYETAWKSGCKGITIYRDKCRTGILVKDEKKNDPERIQKTEAPKRPQKLEADIHHVKVTKKLDKVRTFEYKVIVGLLSGDPYEVFAIENHTLDRKYNKCNIKKLARGKYNLEFDDGNSFNDITSSTTEEEDAITRMISTSLRHGADVSFVVHQLEKINGDLASFTKAISRALKKYINDGVKVSGEECINCKTDSLTRNSGCVTCRNCGWTKC